MALTDVAGIRVGHWTDAETRTGCTVVLAPAAGAVAGVDVRGGAPGTRETDLLRVECTVDRVHAVLLTGGSAFGLAAADGVMRWLAERKVGLAVGPALVPIVPGAVIFDLAVGSPTAHPDREAGYQACVDAERGAGCTSGRHGAGTGATVSKLFGAPRPGGLGTASVRLPDGATVGALAVVNAIGDIVDRSGQVIGGEAGSWARVLQDGLPARPLIGANSTIAVVATDARLDKTGCTRLAMVAHDAFALAIRPVHTPFDGDTVFALSTGDRESDLVSLGVATVEALRTAIERAVTES